MHTTEDERWTPGWSNEPHTWIDPWCLALVQDLLVEADAVGWTGVVLASDLPHALLVDNADKLIAQLHDDARHRYRSLWEGHRVPATPTLLIVGSTYAADPRIDRIARWGSAADMHLAVDRRSAATEAGFALRDHIAGMRRLRLAHPLSA